MAIDRIVISASQAATGHNEAIKLEFPAEFPVIYEVAYNAQFWVTGTKPTGYFGIQYAWGLSCKSFTSPSMSDANPTNKHVSRIYYESGNRCLWPATAVGSFSDLPGTSRLQNKEHFPFTEAWILLAAETPSTTVPLYIQHTFIITFDSKKMSNNAYIEALRNYGQVG